jgi:hypothetical protein
LNSFVESMDEYRSQLRKGTIQTAYRGLMDYIMRLRAYFEKKYPKYEVSGAIYAGYMDMTYFSFFPETLKARGLKVGVVFLHETFRFEVWLFGYNKKVQAKYWRQFRETGFNNYHVPPTTKGVDSIVEGVLIENPDFGDLDVLTKKIEDGTLKFIEGVETFLSKQTEGS